MPAALFPEEVRHSFLLVCRARKIVREAAPGEAGRDFGELTRRAANTGDIGTYEAMAVWLATCTCACVARIEKRRTYRMQENWG